MPGLTIAINEHIEAKAVELLANKQNFTINNLNAANGGFVDVYFHFKHDRGSDLNVGSLVADNARLFKEVVELQKQLQVYQRSWICRAWLFISSLGCC